VGKERIEMSPAAQANNDTVAMAIRTRGLSKVRPTAPKNIAIARNTALRV
jgi:hypothetical protein